jgi:hypothetical protein
MGKKLSFLVMMEIRETEMDALQAAKYRLVMYAMEEMKIIQILVQN